jgi:hypothetical protein
MNTSSLPATMPSGASLVGGDQIPLNELMMELRELHKEKRNVIDRIKDWKNEERKIK